MATRGVERRGSNVEGQRPGESNAEGRMSNARKRRGACVKKGVLKPCKCDKPNRDGLFLHLKCDNTNGTKGFLHMSLAQGSLRLRQRLRQRLGLGSAERARGEGKKGGPKCSSVPQAMVRRVCCTFLSVPSKKAKCSSVPQPMVPGVC